MNLKRLSTIVLGVALISACGRGKKDTKNEAVLTDAVDVCGSVNTSNEDAKGSYSKSILDKVNFNLYWLGGSASPINFWTDRGLDKHVSITAIPLSVNELDSYDQSVKSTINCLEDVISANKCKATFEEMLSSAKEFSDQKAKALEEGDEDVVPVTETQKQSFSCASEFLTREIEKLNTFISEESAE